MNLTKEIWDKKDYQEYVKYLKSLIDEKNILFTKKLVDTKYEVLGIKIPILKSIAKEIVKGNYLSFLNLCQFNYFEEVFIYGFVISYSKDKDVFNKYIYNYIDLVDNWSLCDSFSMSLKHINNFNFFKNLIHSNKQYYIRVGIVSILGNYVKDDYIDEIFNIIDSVDNSTYYIDMALSWLMAECFIKFRDKTLKYIKTAKVNNFVFNKFISKCCDSYRVSESDKKYLKTLKRKEA